MRVLMTASFGLVAYVFAGYPALMALLARLRPRPVHADPGYEPRVTLIIAAFNEADVIEDKLRNVRSLDYPRERLQVIVVADGSDDDTAARAARFADVEVLHRPERAGKLAAVNRAIAHADGEVLVLSDANNMYAPQTVRALVAPLADPAVGLVGGAKVIDDGSGRALDQAEGAYWKYESRLKAWESVVGSVMGVPGEVLAFRREVYRSPEAGILNEDSALAMLVALDGWRVVYAPEARSVERASATLGDEATRRTRLARGRAQLVRRLLPRLARRRPLLAWQFVSHKGLRPAVPWALASGLVSTAVGARRDRLARAILLLQVGFYGAAAGGGLQERRGRRYRLLYLPYYFCAMNLATARGVLAARGRPDNVWKRVKRG